MANVERLTNFINGEFVPPKEGRFLDKIDPATALKIYELPDSTEIDVVAAIQAAQKAFRDWSEMKVEDRSRLLLKVAQLIDDNREELALAESLDVGKTLELARTLDIPRASLNFRFFATRILHKSETASEMDGEAINYTLRHPLGVAGLISPWNLPLYLLTWKIAPALATGNTVVCKPSEFTSKTAWLLMRLMKEAGIPNGVCNLVIGRGDPAGRMLVEHPGVPLISFTGGTKTGETIQRLAATHTKRLSLELGGKNATLVMDDADLKRAIPMIVRSSFLNQGEICLCGSKILVQEKIYQEFLKQFVAAVKEIKVGDPRSKDTFMGPVIYQAHFDKVMSAIELAKKENGKVLCGGVKPSLPAPFDKGYFIEPTVIEDLTNCSELHQTEIFGPMVTVNSFKYPVDAVKWANNSPYGLSASVWTRDLSRAHKVAAQLDVGTVWINTWLKRDLRMPFGGAKASGVGREGGDHSFDFFTETKTVCVQL